MAKARTGSTLLEKRRLAAEAAAEAARIAVEQENGNGASSEGSEKSEPSSDINEAPPVDPPVLEEENKDTGSQGADPASQEQHGSHEDTKDKEQDNGEGQASFDDGGDVHVDDEDENSDTEGGGFSAEDDELRNRSYKIERSKQVDSNKRTRTIRWLLKNESHLIFDLPIQRRYLWTDHQAGMIGHSAFLGYYIPPLLLNKKPDGTYEVIDGVQRGTSILRIATNKMKFPKTIPPIYGGEEIRNKFLKDLPEDIQNAFLDSELMVQEFDNLSDEEVREMFIRQNSGSLLSKFILVRMEASDKTLEQVKSLAKLPFFAEYLQLSPKQRKEDLDQKVVFTIAALMMQDEKIGTTAEEIGVFIKSKLSGESSIPEDVFQSLVNVTGFLYDAFEVMEEAHKKRALRMTHVPMIFVAAAEAMKKGAKPKHFFAWAKDFYIDSYDQQLDYKLAASKSVTKKDHIIIREREALAHLERNLKID